MGASSLLRVKIVVLTGAGVSADSGLATFRDAGGLWEGHRPEDVATPAAFATNREVVQRFYDHRREGIQRVQPNAAHDALARLGRALGSDLFLVTQNIDDLHERAGSPVTHHMHGEILRALCQSCGDRVPWTEPLLPEPDCPSCGARRSLRPDVVWFGEVPYLMRQIQHALHDCDLFVSIGTSGRVYPAAAFVDWANERGARTLELNLERAANTEFAESRRGHATELVPAWVDAILAELHLTSSTTTSTRTG